MSTLEPGIADVVPTASSRVAVVAPDFVPSESVERLNRQLDELQMETMHNVVQDVEYEQGDMLHACKLLFLTNPQALKIDMPKLAKVKDALEIGSPKLVIHLMPSRHFPSDDYTTHPMLRHIRPFETDSELSDEAADRVRAQATRLAHDVLLPLAIRTSALVIGSHRCGLMGAFVRAAAPVFRQQVGTCPFSILCYADATQLQVRASKFRGVAGQLKRACKKWSAMDAEREEAISRRYGSDRAFWEHGDLPCGASHFIVLDGVSLAPDGPDCDSQPGQHLISNFVSHMACYLPVISVLAFGVDIRLRRMQHLADYVHRGLPVLLLDCREQKAEKSQSLRAGGSVQEGGRMEATLRRAAEELKALQEQLHGMGRVDFYHVSLLARFKAVLDRVDAGRGEEREDREEREEREERHLWLHQAIVAAKQTLVVGVSDGTADERRLQEELDAGAATAIRLLMEHTGRDAEYMSAECRKGAVSALDAVLKAKTWDELARSWKDHYPKLRGSCLWDVGETRAFAAQNSTWCQMTVEREETARGFEWLELAEAGPLEEAQRKLEKMISSHIASNDEYDAVCLSKRAMASNDDLWLALYGILRSPNVQVANIFDLGRCKQELQLMANVDRLPHKNSLQALVLLRNAWTLRDICSLTAYRYKFAARLAYSLMLLIGFVVVVLVTVASAFPGQLSPDSQKYAMLGLSLGLSFVSAWTVFIDPLTKWLQLKGGALALESEIWRFRTRVGPYSVGGFGGGQNRLQSECVVETRFHNALLGAREAVLRGAGLRQTSFFALATATAELHGSSAKPQQLGASHIQHGQYGLPDDDDGECCPAGLDNHHSPVAPNDFVAWRLAPTLRFFQGRIPHYARQRVVLQAMTLLASICSAVLSSTGNPQWTAVLTAFASSLVTWQEFTNTSRKLDRHSSVANALSKLMVWWQTLPAVDQQNLHTIQALVERTETIIGSERAAWVAEAQLANKALMQAADHGHGQQPGPAAQQAQPSHEQP